MREEAVLTTRTLFWLSLLNFHPILEYSFRFDPTLGRSDRFGLLFLQLTTLATLCFFTLKDYDRKLPESSKVKAVNLEKFE
jgi:hypothetical protein